MLHVMDLYIEMKGVEAAVARGLIHADDVGAVAAQDTRDDGKRPRLVLDHDRQPGGAAVRFVSPGEIDPIGVDPGRETVAADRMDLDLLILAAQPDDPVARDRVAAFGELEGDAGRCGGGFTPSLPVDPGTSASITATSVTRFIAIASIRAASSWKLSRFSASAIASQPSLSGRRWTISS